MVLARRGPARGDDGGRRGAGLIALTGCGVFQPSYVIGYSRYSASATRAHGSRFEVLLLLRVLETRGWRRTSAVDALLHPVKVGEAYIGLRQELGLLLPGRSSTARQRGAADLTHGFRYGGRAAVC